MVLRFSCHGQMNRFNVAPVPEIIEGLQQRRVSLINKERGGGRSPEVMCQHDLHCAFIAGHHVWVTCTITEGCLKSTGAVTRDLPLPPPGLHMPK